MAISNKDNSKKEDSSLDEKKNLTEKELRINKNKAINFEVEQKLYIDMYSIL